jgi:hypothetical protein
MRAHVGLVLGPGFSTLPYVYSRRALKSYILFDEI